MRGVKLVPWYGTKLQFQSLSLFLLLLLFISCKKQDDITDIPQQYPAKEIIIPKIESWLDKQKTDLTDLPANAVAKIDLLKESLDYNNLYLERYRASEDFIIVPVSERYQSQNNKGKNPVNYLVVVLKNKDSITNGNIIQYISSGDNKEVTQNTFTKVFTYKNLDCSGKFTILDVADYFQNELAYENGKLRSVKDLGKRTSPNGSSGRVNAECMDWYEQTWYIWEDGTVELLSEVYVFTSCDGDCWQPRIANARTYNTNDCNPGGGGGNPIEYEYLVSKPWKFVIDQRYNNDHSILWMAQNYENISGVKKASEPCGGHFTSIVHVNSYLLVGNGYTWTELGNTVSINSPCEVQSWIDGKVTKNSNGEFSTAWKTLKTKFYDHFF